MNAVFDLYDLALLLLSALLIALTVKLIRYRADFGAQLRARTAELQENREIYRGYFATYQGCAFITSVEGTFIDFNDAVPAFFGYQNREELLGVRITEIFAVPAECDAQLALIREKGLIREQPVHLKRKDGTSLFALVTAMARRDRAERVIGFQGSIRDITLREKAEQAMRDAVRRLNDMIEFLPDATFMVDLDGKIIVWNRAMEAMTGCSKEEMLGKGEYEYAIPFYGERRPLLIDYALRSSEEIEQLGYYEIRRNDDLLWADAFIPRLDHGAAAYLSGTAARLYNAVGEVVGAVESIRDVTQRKQAETHLQESENKFNQVLKAAQDAIIMIDSQGRIILWNDAAVRMFGYDTEEALGRDLHQLLAPVRFHEAHAVGFAEFRRTGSGPAVGIMLELAALRKGGEEFPVEISLSSLLLHGEWHAIGILRDITERRQAQNELVATNAQLEQAIARADEMALQAELANQAKSEFLANMSHEIRTPMNGVIGMSGLLLDTELTAEQRQYAQLVRSSGEALLRVINDILDFSKIEARKLELEVLDFNLRATLEDAAELLALKAEEKGLELVCMIDPATPLWLRGDPGRLRQVLVNLGGNAVKFTHEGEVVIRAGLANEDDQQAMVRFTISDTGIGIPDDRIGTLFSPFTQVDGSTTRRYGGTGLGLSISKQLVELMGGQIAVESREGEGSIFSFAAIFGKQPPDARHLSALADLTNVRVLVVDDHPTNRLLATTLARSWGCRIDETSDPRSTLSLLRTAARSGDPYQVALLDMQMPEIDGEELGRLIKADPGVRDTVLIMMTSLGQRGDARRLAGLGFATYLTKPIRQEQLHDALALALGRKTRGTETTPQPLITRHTVAEARLQGARILLIEDNITNQQVAVALLKKLGCRVEVAANGQEALEALRTIPYDLVLMDCHMPEMDGFEATRRIRNADSTVLDVTIPVIAMTARTMAGDREECLQAGMNDYLAKPIDLNTLAAMLAKWLPTKTGNLNLGSGGMEHESDGLKPEAQEGSGLDGHLRLSNAECAAPVPVFDRTGLVSRVMGDEELLKLVISTFLAELPVQMEALQACIETGDSLGVAQKAHTIRGAAASIGGEALCEVAWEMEKNATTGDLKAVSALFQELAKQRRALAAELKLETR